MTDAARALVGEFASALGLAPGRVRFEGAATLPSAYPVSDLAAAAIGVAALAAARLAGARETVVDRSLADGWFGAVCLPADPTVELPSPWDAIAGNYRTLDGWVRLHTNAPAHRAAALRVLGLDPGAADHAAVAAAVSTWAATALEDAVVAAGGAAGELRTAAEWAAHPQGRAVVAEPLVDRVDTEAEPPPGPDLPGGARPLAGIRVLDLTRVLAGPTATQFLAGLGADVLRIDPPDWDEPAVLPQVMSGKRSARLDLREPADADALRALLHDADVLVHGLRPGALERLGFGVEERVRLRPGLVDVALDAYGWTGPWAARRAFDSVVQLSSGIADTGMREAGADAPVALPVQALDVATGYLMAAGALAALGRRRGARIRLSLARTAVELERTRARVLAGELERAPSVDAPELPRERIESGWGPLRRLRPAARIPGVRIGWDLPPRPLGGDAPAW